MGVIKTATWKANIAAVIICGMFFALVAGIAFLGSKYVPAQPANSTKWFSLP